MKFDIGTPLGDVAAEMGYDVNSHRFTLMVTNAKDELLLSEGTPVQFNVYYDFFERELVEEDTAFVRDTRCSEIKWRHPAAVNLRREMMALANRIANDAKLCRKAKTEGLMGETVRCEQVVARLWEDYQTALKVQQQAELTLSRHIDDR